MIKLTKEQYKAFLLFKGMTKEERAQFIKQHEEGGANDGQSRKS